MWDEGRGMASPLKAFVNIRREELPFALCMFAHFFLVIASFWILKPLKKGLFIEHYDLPGLDLFGHHLRASQAELLAKVGNLLVAFAAMALFSWLSRRLRRQELTIALLGAVQLGLVGFALTLDQPGTATVWCFYLFGDLYNMLMLAAFFAFLNDSVSPDQAKRLYGLVVLGGVLGGVTGSTILRTLVDRLSPQTWMWAVFGAGILVGVSAVISGMMVDKRPVGLGAWRRREITERRGAPVLSAARTVLRSRYLLSIAALVGMYEMVSTLADFQFTETVSHYLNGRDIRAHLSTVYMITNGVSMAVQILGTSFVMSRLGVGRALMILPAAIAVVSAGFLAVPALWVGSLLSVADNGLNYSVNQSAKEALYVPARRGEKYGAKAFIDIFVQRFAKTAGVGLGLLLSVVFVELASVRWLSLVVLILAGLWLLVARFAGMKFNLYSQDGGSRGDDDHHGEEAQEESSEGCAEHV